MIIELSLRTVNFYSLEVGGGEVKESLAGGGYMVFRGKGGDISRRISLKGEGEGEGHSNTANQL